MLDMFGEGVALTHVGALVSSETLKVATRVVALVPTTERLARNCAPSSAVVTGTKVIDGLLAPAMSAKSGSLGFLRCHWMQTGRKLGVAVTPTLKVTMTLALVVTSAGC